MNDRDAIAIAARLQAFGVQVRSASLLEKGVYLANDKRAGGNRATRRAAKRAARRKGA